MKFRYWHHHLASFTCMLIVLMAGATESQGEEFGTSAPISKTPILDTVIQSWPVDPAMTLGQERALWEALCQPYSPIAIEIPLDRWVDTVASICPMEIDRVALEGIGLSSEQPVSFRPDTPPRSLLVHLLSALEDLECIVEIRHGVVRITTIDMADSRLPVRIYDITPLLDGRDSREKLAAVSVLIHTIQNVIDPDGWDVLGGVSVIQMFPTGIKQLLCVATRTDTHWHLQSFLDQLHRAGGNPLAANSAVRRRALSSVPKFIQSEPQNAPERRGPVPPIATELPRFQPQ